MTNLPDIIKSIINQINLNLEVVDVDVDKLFVCETTLHLTKTKIVVIDGKDYTVIDFDLNNWVQVAPLGHSDPVPADTKVMIAPPIHFLDGDPYSANAEYLQISTQTLEKTPFIWLLGNYEIEDLPRDSSIDLAFNARLFFLDWADEPEWLNDDHNKYVIKPMQNLQKAFNEVIENDYNFKTLGTVPSVVRPRFGVSIKPKDGMKQPKEKIIDEDLSGIDSRYKIEVYDASICTCD